MPDAHQYDASISEAQKNSQAIICHSELVSESITSQAEGVVCHHAFDAQAKKLAFTLAEVLITLGIIGVVAALTLPTLIQSHTNKVVETRLASFYSKINQALLMAELEFGDRTSWFEYDAVIENDEEGNVIPGSSTAEKWFNKYFAPYLNILDVQYDDVGRPYYYLADGSAMKLRTDTSTSDWLFFPGNPLKCLQKYPVQEDSIGKCSFAFLYYPKAVKSSHVTSAKFHIGKGFEPYMYNWDGTPEGLIKGDSASGLRLGCNSELDQGRYCTALIQQNGWKIPKDYPFKVSY